MRRTRSTGHLLSVLCMVAAVALPAPAAAGGGDYLFDTGSEAARSQVRRALDASSFDWGLVPVQVAIHIAPGIPSRATPGHVWLDERLLSTGRFAWAVVQDEYAHQVDFFLLDDAQRRRLTYDLGATVWSRSEAAGLAHSDYGSERFASMLVWAYWPSRHNAYRPKSPQDEAAALPPAAFRTLVSSLLPLVTR
ncbi:MAG: hypothetical protein WD067_10575 [Gaiellaceae bacterium]